VVRKDRIGETNITQTPAIVIEVLSPGTARIDKMLKFSRYQEGGIEQYWVVDPRVPSIEVYQLTDGAYQLLTQGSGTEDVPVAGPLTLTVVPQELVEP
jgi:Uma2 family endonuclease